MSGGPTLPPEEQGTKQGTQGTKILVKSYFQIST